jgi:hypothetical protein
VSGERERAERRRELACEFAAIVLAGQPVEDRIPYGWSLAVFFERYMEHGATGTMKDFGPKKPKKLKVVK